MKIKSSLTKEELLNYLSKQLKNFFPDDEEFLILEEVIAKALKKTAYNFKHIKLNYFYNSDGELYFNHLNADQYLVFIYYASNIAYEDYNHIQLASKLFYLNKILHNFHCMYDTKLPDIFLVIHGGGIVLGKAKYSDYFVVMHGVTVGSNSKWESPTLGKGIVMYPNSSLIGNSIVEDGTCFSIGSTLIDQNTPQNIIVIGNGDVKNFKKQKNKKISIYFKDLSKGDI